MQISTLSTRFAFILALAVTSFALGPVSAAKTPLSLARIPYIHVIAFDPIDAEKLLIATTRGLYRVGRDGKLETMLDEKYEIAGFLISADGQKMLASGKKNGRGMGVMQTTNGGLS